MHNNTPPPILPVMLKVNERRLMALHGVFDPITGKGSLGKRAPVEWYADGTVAWLPEPMLADPLAMRVAEAGSVMKAAGGDPKKAKEMTDALERLRLRHDFPYWAAKYARIKPKGGGDDCPLVLTNPQRKFAARIEEMRLAGKPIRLILLKARQWGGSTVAQLYMAWLQLVHQKGLNSLIIAHQGAATDEIMDMYLRLINAYPDALLADPGSPPPPGPKIGTAGKSRSAFRLAARNCKVKIGTAERPDSCRGGDYNLVHLSEVGLWKQTLGKKPEDIVRAVCSGILYKPMTMIVYESTANGIGNFFHREYIDARDNPRAQFKSVFVAWHEIEQNSLAFSSQAEKKQFAADLWLNRHKTDAPSQREEPGKYLWRLWEMGATLEGINWYVVERAKHMDHGSMAAECPSDDTEAFVNSGAAVFDMYQVEKLRPGCMPPKWTGDVAARADSGPEALECLRFVEDRQGMLRIWRLPDAQKMEHRYLAVVDIGGRSRSADWSVIAVFDRRDCAAGGLPEIVAQWYGHIDMDLLAWKAMQIAAFYDFALLVIESNKLETHDAERHVDGDQSQFILNQVRRAYPNLYARRQSEEDIRQGRPRRYGFHTNVSTKPMVISTLVKAVREQLWVERDERCLAELLVYERKQNGSYGAIVGAHDDLLMTRAIGLHIAFNEMPLPAETACSQQSPASSPQHLF